MRTKEDIIGDHYTCTCGEIYTSRKMIDPSCVLHDAGPEIGLMMDEYAKRVAIELLNFVTDEKSPFGIMYGNQPDRFVTEKRKYTSEEVYNLYQQEAT